MFEPEVNDDGTVVHTATLTTHLLELRKRLLRIALYILAVTLGLLPFANEVYHLVSTPLLASMPEGSQMIATEVASPFLTPFKLTFFTAFFITMPAILLEVWGFVAPALYKHEKKLFLPVIFFSIILFYSGMAFAFFVVFPVIFSFFAGAGPEGVAYTPDISHFLNTALKLLFAFGLAFQIPIFTSVLIRTGATTAESLSQKRPYIIVGCFIAGMLLTPPDPISQCLMAIPMWLLFEFGLVLGKLSGIKSNHKNNDDEALG